MFVCLVVNNASDDRLQSIHWSIRRLFASSLFPIKIQARKLQAKKDLSAKNLEKEMKKFCSNILLCELIEIELQAGIKLFAKMGVFG